MNVFVIPSWYPSPSNPLNGVFIKEQVIAIAKMYGDINFGISVWGQNNEDFLLHAREPVKGIQKFFTPRQSSVLSISSNVEEYFTPAFSFTNKLFGGNIKNIVGANYENLKRFESKYGRVDVIHAHVCYKGGYIAQQISKSLNIPYVLTEHIGPFPQKHHTTNSGELLPQVKSAITDANIMTAVSSDLAEVIKSFDIKREVEVIPNFIGEVEKPKEVFSDRKVFNFITVTGMLATKGIKTLLEGIRVALKVDRALHFTMVGGGPDLLELKEYASALKIQKNITWTGMIAKKNIGQYLERSDAHILVSNYESFGVVYIEAMAYGLPNIAAALGGPKDIIDEETGVLINTLKPESIAEKMLWMKQNYVQFDRQKIINSFKRRFSNDAIVPKIRKLYERLTVAE